VPELTPLDILGVLIDNADEQGDHNALEHAIASLEAIDKSTYEPIERATISYYLANAFAGLRKLNKEDTNWSWSLPLIEQEIFYNRLAKSELPAGVNSDFLRSRIITNLANALNFTGRFVESIELWSQVLHSNKDFGMALANKGHAYFWYARYVQPNKDQVLLLRDSHDHLSKALAVGVESHAIKPMTSLFKHISGMTDWNSLKIEPRSYVKNLSIEERNYRNWSKAQGLFLSPINDLNPCPEIEDIRDTLVLPGVLVTPTTDGAELPVFYGIFNQAKQEYTSARYLVYEAIEERGQDLHFADRGVVLYDALDYRLYRLWVERMKMAFLAAHAILDKLAYLMNSYWELGLKSKEVSFSEVWYSKGKKKNGIAPIFQDSRKNWPLKGLYWLSKDFHDKSNAKRELAPEPRMLQEIRNHIAHKYLRVHDHFLSNLQDDRGETPNDFSYQVTDDELQAYTIKLLKLVRSAMIYLTAAITHEEMDRRAKIGEELVASLPIYSVKDDCRL
jgi:tetratricopeptide (TPR) repeat protein